MPYFFFIIITFCVKAHRKWEIHGRDREREEKEISKRKKLHPAIKFLSQRHCLKKATRSICKLTIKRQKQQSGERNIELRRNVNIIKRSFINKFISFFFPSHWNIPGSQQFCFVCCKEERYEIVKIIHCRKVHLRDLMHIVVSLSAGPLKRLHF